MNNIASLLHRADQVMNASRLEALRDLHLTPRQYQLLECYANGNNLSQTDAVNQTGVDRSTLADITRRLVNRGLLKRKRTKDDARAYKVGLTPTGITVLYEARHLVMASDKHTLSALTDADIKKISSGLQKIKSSQAEERKAA